MTGLFPFANTPQIIKTYWLDLNETRLNGLKSISVDSRISLVSGTRLKLAGLNAKGPLGLCSIVSFPVLALELKIES